MKARLIGVSFGLAVLATTSLGSSGQTGKDTPSRLDQIWEVANSRIFDQVDSWFEDGDYPKVIQLLIFQSVLDPHSYEISTNLGWMQENVEDYPAAIKTYEQYHVENPNEPDNLMPLAELYYRQRKYAKVVPLLNPIINRKGLHPNNYRMLATSYERLNKLQDAKRVLTLYLKIAPNDGASKNNLARIERKIKGGK